MNVKSKCPLCSKSYQSLKDLEKHCKKYHNVDLQTVREMQKSVPSIKFDLSADYILGD